ncbi:hypothetical protein B9Z55_025348 [Caenorhabditis nigoni]|uniref:Uncharacterized protein n=1 Tax=Caenorhabditis nigoni TaxID=1611254 RepID=A0A2G5SYF5_9PELO|nr:hypothetical protein B9Z55_025348 [Caenorhabditis nigoni]
MTPEQLREEPNIGVAPGLEVPDFPEAPEPEQEPELEPEPRPATPPPLPPRGQRQQTPPPVPPRPDVQARERAREDSPPPALQPRADGIPQNIGWIHQFRNARRDHQRGRNEDPRRGGRNIDQPPRPLDQAEILFLQRLGVRQQREFLDMILDGQFPLPIEAFEDQIGNLDVQDAPNEDMGFFDDDEMVDDGDWN